MHSYPSSGQPGSPDVAAFYDKASGSWQYVAWCHDTRKAVIIDPVMDFDPAAGATGTTQADRILKFVSDEGLEVVWVLDTHPHADHFSAAHYLADKLDAKQGIGALVLKVQEIWADLYADDAMAGHPEFWDQLFEPGDVIPVGNCEIQVILSTGHTLASVSYLMGDAIFAHDTFMVPDSGTSRADFPGGSTEELWDSLQRILSLPLDTRIFVGHDYGKDGRDPECMATVARHRAENIHVRDGIPKETFLETRSERDATLPLPDRMLYALQVNIRGGRLPEADAKGRAVFRIPVNRCEP
jgi:glyoxylase-like metal-dependent hydrolase (beta-lactamase superfamily II)